MLRVFAGGIAVLLCASCAGPRPDLTLGLSPDEFARFLRDDIVFAEAPSPYAKSVEEELDLIHGAGTAVRIGRNVFATARHLVEYIPVIYHDRRRLSIEVLAKGEGPCMDGIACGWMHSPNWSTDWIIYRTLNTEDSDIAPPVFDVDFSHVPEVGELVYMVGFPGVRIPQENEHIPEPTVAPARVVRRPYWYDAKLVAAIDRPDRFIPLKPCRKGTINGVSGGPLLAVKGERLVVVGIFQSEMTWERWYAPTQHVYVVVRPEAWPVCAGEEHYSVVGEPTSENCDFE